VAIASVEKSLCSIPGILGIPRLRAHLLHLLDQHPDQHPEPAPSPNWNLNVNLSWNTRNEPCLTPRCMSLIRVGPSSTPLGLPAYIPTQHLYKKFWQLTAFYLLKRRLSSSHTWSFNIPRDPWVHLDAKGF